MATCASKDCFGQLVLVESEGGTVWGGVCPKCGKHNERCQVCGGFFVQMWRHVKLLEPWANDGPEPADRVKMRERAQACLDGNPLFRTARKAKDFGKGAP